MNFNDVDLNLLRVFEALFREQSVSRAAAHLGRTQSAVSHSLSKLRVIFNDELFTRDAGGMRPTVRALGLLPDVSAALTTLRAAVDRHQLFRPEETGRNFRVGLMDYHAKIFLPGLLKQLATLAPRATLNSIPTIGPEVGAMIQSGQLDCAIVGSFEGRDSQLQEIILGQDSVFCAVWSESNIAKQRLTLERYLESPHLQISADGVSEGVADVALRQIGRQRKTLVTISNYLIMPAVLKGTELIAHCGGGIVEMLDDKTEVMFTRPPLRIPSLKMSLVFHRQMATDPATLWFRSLIEQIYKGMDARKQKALSNSRFIRW